MNIGESALCLMTLLSTYDNVSTLTAVQLYTTCETPDYDSLSMVQHVFFVHISTTRQRGTSCRFSVSRHHHASVSPLYSIRTYLVIIWHMPGSPMPTSIQRAVHNVLRQTRRDEDRSSQRRLRRATVNRRPQQRGGGAPQEHAARASYAADSTGVMAAKAI